MFRVMNESISSDSLNLECYSEFDGMVLGPKVVYGRMLQPAGRVPEPVPVPRYGYEVDGYGPGSGSRDTGKPAPPPKKKLKFMAFYYIPAMLFFGWPSIEANF
jgi:hypothetical protein